MKLLGLKKLIGLTGGIGSGKSTVAAMLADLGAVVIDADAISKSTTAANGAAIDAIKAAFGADFVDASNALDRLKMRELVFSDSGAKAKLEAIVHPLIHTQMQAQIAAAHAVGKTVVLDLPLLVERTSFSGWRPQLDAVWVVDCSEETQIARVQARNKFTREQVLSIMANQASRAARMAAADAVIGNDDVSLAQLKSQVKYLWHCHNPMD